ncbi:hypothetical protein, partial [Enterococcus durans]
MAILRIQIIWEHEIQDHFDQSIDSSEITKNLRQKFSPSVPDFLGSILFDVGEVRQHLFCIKKYRKDT